MAENTSPRWVAGLSNGETLIEGKGICIHDDTASSWTRLQNYLKDNELAITSFGLWVEDRHFNLPSNKPKFNGIAPLSYNCYRTWSGVIGGSKEEYICAEANYMDYKVQLFIDLDDNNKSWLNVINT